MERFECKFESRESAVKSYNAVKKYLEERNILLDDEYSNNYKKKCKKNKDKKKNVRCKRNRLSNSKERENLDRRWQYHARLSENRHRRP